MRIAPLAFAMLLSTTASTQDQAPTRTTAAPRIRPAREQPAAAAASPRSTAVTDRCVAVADAADRSGACAQLSKSNPAIVDPNPVVPPKPTARRVKRPR